MLVDGKDQLSAIIAHARSRIGLVPQELTTDAFESVLATRSAFSRGLFGKPRDPAKIETICSAACRCGTSARRR